jgi:hypothetical protein
MTCKRDAQLASDACAKTMSPRPAPWFDVENIKRGVESMDKGGSYEPRFWIDEERGVFYGKIID